MRIVVSAPGFVSVTYTIVVRRMRRVKVSLASSSTCVLLDGNVACFGVINLIYIFFCKLSFEYIYIHIYKYIRIMIKKCTSSNNKNDNDMRIMASITLREHLFITFR